MKICVYNLGCKVNQYENDVLVHSLCNQHEVITTLDFADLYILNTCAVTNEGEKKSRQVLSKIYKINPKAKIIVCGCASQKNPQQFLDKPNVVAVFGNVNKTKAELLLNAVGNNVTELKTEYEEGISTSKRTRSYLKIQDGCNNFCSYCIIPYLRGRSRSRQLDCIKKEAQLLSTTSKEIVLVGINLSDYKINNELALVDVVEELSQLPVRVRLGSLEVNIITEDNLLRLKKVTNFCPHFHLSLQSGSNNVLKKMNRHYTREEFISKCNMIYKIFPNASITTDVIVAFPTETDEDFLQTIDLIKKVNFYSVHFFIYSKRDGTVASRLPIINGSIAKNRENKLKEVVDLSRIAFLTKHINNEITMLTEDYDGGFTQGYSENYIKCYLDEKLDNNQFVKVKPVKIYKEGYIVRRI